MAAPDVQRDVQPDVQSNVRSKVHPNVRRRLAVVMLVQLAELVQVESR